MHSEGGQALYWFRRSHLAVSLALLLLTAAVEPLIDVRWQYLLLSWIVASGCLFLLLGEYVDFGRERGWHLDIGRAAIISSGLTLVIFPNGYGYITAFFGVVLLLMSAALRSLFNRNLAWMISFVLFGVAVPSIEAALHIYRPIETGPWGELPALETHPTRVYGLKPDSRTRLRYNNYDYELVTNSLGLPGPEITAKKPDTYRILVVGDAFTMPEGVQFEDCYVSLLQRKFDESALQVEVVNAGVTGYGPNETLAQARELVPLLDADLVIYQFFVNEFAEINLDGDRRREGIGLSDQALDLRSRYIGRSQLLNRLFEVKEGILEKITGVSPGWKYTKSLLAFYDREDSAVYDEHTLERIEFALSALQTIARNKLVILYTPSAIEVTDTSHLSYFPKMNDGEFSRSYDLDLPFNNLSAIVNKLNIPMLDPRPELSEERENYFRESWHWTKSGHRTVADYLFSQIEIRQNAHNE